MQASLDLMEKKRLTLERRPINFGLHRLWVQLILEDVRDDLVEVVRGIQLERVASICIEHVDQDVEGPHFMSRLFDPGGGCHDVADIVEKLLIDST
jgi:hypothetical protein